MFRFVTRWRSAIAACACLLLAGTSARAAEEELSKEASSSAAVPSLSVVVALVRKRAPEVLTGEAQVVTARSSMIGARLPPLGNPYVEFITKGRPDALRNLDVDGQLWLPVEVAGQRGTRIDEARALIDFQQKSLRYSRAVAVARAIQAYGVVNVGAERIRLFGSLLDVARSEAKSYEARYAAGDVTLRDEKLSELELGRYGVLLEEARADVLEGFAELNRLTGASYSRLPDALFRVPQSMLSVPADLETFPAVDVSRAEASYYWRSRERLRREGAAGALSLILNGGRDEFGAGRLGVGVGYAFPVLHRNQGEIARATAERSRALLDARLTRRVLGTRIETLRKEFEQVGRALEVLESEAEPAAIAAVDAATQMQRAGKSDLLPVLTSRRDLGLLRLRRLELVAREWSIASSLYALVGETS